MARNIEKDKKPCVLDEGFGCCTYCGQMTHIQVVQDIVEMEGYFIPDVIHQCLYCGERWWQYRRGDYDPLLALYQTRARNIYHHQESTPANTHEAASSNSPAHECCPGGCVCQGKGEGSLE